MKFLKCQMAFLKMCLGLYLHDTLGSDFEFSSGKTCEPAAGPGHSVETGGMRISCGKNSKGQWLSEPLF